MEAAYGAGIAPAGPGAVVAFPLPQPTRPPPPAAAAKIQNDLRILTERLARINDNLARKISSRNEYDKTIQETEAAYAKVRPPCAAPPIRHGHSTCLACGRASTCTSAAATAPGGGGCVRAAAPVLVRVDHGEPTLATLALTDHGEFANAAARAQAGERQPHEEEAGVQLIGRRRTLKASPLSRAGPPPHVHTSTPTHARRAAQ